MRAGSDAESRRERDWRNGMLLIVAAAVLPILVVALVQPFQV